jgi:hypothetical protein
MMTRLDYKVINLIYIPSSFSVSYAYRFVLHKRNSLATGSSERPFQLGKNGTYHKYFAITLSRVMGSPCFISTQHQSQDLHGITNEEKNDKYVFLLAQFHLPRFTGQ